MSFNGGLTWLKDKFTDYRRKTWGPNRQPRYRKRVVLKDGDPNVHRRKFLRNRKWRYLQDIFTTLVDMQWRYTLSFLVCGFCGSWLTFTLLWWLIAFVHGDLHDDHLPDKQAESGWTPCVLNIWGFHSCFLYSLETQHTTGYGFRVITEECPEAIFILVSQCICGMMIDSFTVGIVFAKMVRSKFATHTVQFSRNAVVTLRDGQLCIIFRVGDIKKKPMIGVAIRAILFQKNHTTEGETLENYQTELTVIADGGDSCLNMLWPMEVVHVIDEESPFYKMSASDMLNQKFELVAILDATVQSTGVFVQGRTSYLSNEILWSHKFEQIISFNTEQDCYEVDWKKFDKMIIVPIPLCSAEELDNAHEKSEHNEDSGSQNSDNLISLESPLRKQSSISGINPLLIPTPSEIDEENPFNFLQKIAQLPPGFLAGRRKSSTGSKQMKKRPSLKRRSSRRWTVAY